MRRFIVGVAVACTLALAVPAAAQTRGFLVRLGNDTTAIERFVRNGNHIEGTIVRHLPQTSILKYTIHLNNDGSIAWYEQRITRADGSSPPNAPAKPFKITFTGDSVIRDIARGAEPVTLRAAAPKVTMVGIPGSWLGTELLIAQAKNGTKVHQIGVNAQQAAPAPVEVRLIGSDSAELVAGGFRTGMKLNANGQVVRGDGSLTTQKVIVTPETSANLEQITAAWAAKDAAGGAMGAASTRDTMNAVIGGANIWIDYGRPAKRGRAIWGALVPYDTTWRFGANAATQFKTDKDLDMAGVTIPAGSYTLWLYPTATKSFLIVNSQTGQWGTAHDSSKDVARVPLDPHMSLPAVEERFRIFVQNDMLMMHWDRGGYGVKIKAK